MRRPCTGDEFAEDAKAVAELGSEFSAKAVTQKAA